MLSRNSIRAAVAALAILCSAALNNYALAGFMPGDLITYPQGMWADDPTAVRLLNNNYDSVYESSFSLVEVGIPGPAGHSMIFSAATSVVGYLPATGTLGPLNTDLLDPTSTSSGAFGGEVLALRFNIDFSDAGLLPGALGIPFGNLQLRDLPLNSNLNDLTVRQFIGQANNLLGGGSSLFYSIDQIVHFTALLNSSFGAGGVSIFAQDHLRVIPIPGDYNGNGTVDAADYAKWRNGGPLVNEVDNPGTIDSQDYTEWRSRFGNSSGSGSGATGSASANSAVPEPTTAGLSLVGLLVLACHRGRGRHPC